MFILLVTLSFYQNVIADNAPRIDEVGHLLASLKAVERAAEAMASELELSKAITQPVLRISDSKVNLEDVIKEQKLRKLLELIKENNKVKLQDTDDQSRGPRVFIIKEDVSDDYGKTSENEPGSKVITTRRNKQANIPLRRYPGRRNSDVEIPSDDSPTWNFRESVTHLGLYHEPLTPPKSTPGGKDRSIDNADDEQTTKGNYLNKQVLRGRDWDGHLRPAFPKYTDGPFNVGRDDSPGIAAKSVIYDHSKDESNMLRNNGMRGDRDDSYESGTNKPYRSYDNNLYRGKNQLARTQIPYIGNRNIYEK